MIDLECILLPGKGDERISLESCAIQSLPLTTLSLRAKLQEKTKEKGSEKILFFLKSGEQLYNRWVIERLAQYYVVERPLMTCGQALCSACGRVAPPSPPPWISLFSRNKKGALPPLWSCRESLWQRVLPFLSSSDFEEETFLWKLWRKAGRRAHLFPSVTLCGRFCSSCESEGFSSCGVSRCANSSNDQSSSSDRLVECHGPHH